MILDCKSMVERSYGLNLCRPTDEGGLIHHAKLCQAGSLDEDGMVAALKGSQEFQIHGGNCKSKPFW